LFEGKFEVITGVSDALQSFRRLGYEIHVITRGIEFEQRHKLISTGLLHDIDSVSVTQGAKSVAIKQVIDNRQLLPERCCMVGDSLTGEILPALEIGMRAVLVQPPRRWLHDKSSVIVPDGDPRFRRAPSFESVTSLVLELLHKA